MAAKKPFGQKRKKKKRIKFSKKKGTLLSKQVGDSYTMLVL